MDLWPDGLALAGLVSGAGFGLRLLVEQHREAAERRHDLHKEALRLQAAVLTAPWQPQYPSLTHGTWHGGALQAPPAPALLDPVVGDSAAPHAPAFATLLAQGAIGPGRPLLLGYSAAGPLVGTWKDLYSSAVAGLSGSGKTTTLRFLAAQSAAHGARFLVLDPHADAGDESLAGTLAPLAPAFLAPPAADPRAMLRLLEQAQTIMAGRLAGGPRPWPLIVAVDEFTALMGRSDLAGPLAELIEAIAQEGRKVGCFALISGQIFTAARSGSTALRDALASAYIHRMKRAQARLLIGTDDAARAEGLRAGQALLARATGDVIPVTIPDTTAADITHVAALLQTAVSPVSPPFPPVSAPVSGEILQKRPGPPPEMDAARVEAVREAVQAGMAQGKILEAVWAVKAGGGAAYQAATEEYRAILAWLVQ